MTRRGAPVVWLGRSRDTTYRSNAKNRCARCSVEILRNSVRCSYCTGVLRTEAKQAAGAPCPN